jgi:hypothetical protein
MAGMLCKIVNRRKYKLDTRVNCIIRLRGTKLYLLYFVVLI